MKSLFKTLVLLMIFTLTVNSSFAFSVGKLEKFLKKSSIGEESTLAISIRDVDSNDVIYEKNEKKLLHPASTLKVFSTYVSMNELTFEYFFKTQFYKDTENNLYVKLGADPSLSSSQLKQAIYNLKESGETSFKNLYFDDSIIDKKEFATGWMWDDDINSYTPKVSAYNLDGNVLTVDMEKGQNGLVNTVLKSSYPMSVISVIQDGAKQDYLEVNRYNWNNPEVVEMYGNVSSLRQVEIPISSMRRYFIYNLQKILEDNNITISGTSFASNLCPNNAKLLTEISNSVSPLIQASLQNSNNLMSETLFKVAAAKKYGATGTGVLATEMFNEFYKKLGLDVDKIIVRDGSGVSRNNLIYVDWMTKALNKIYKQKNFELYRDNMAQAGDGTLSERLLPLRGEVWLKTGSLSNISAITGYVKSQDGHTYSVAIIVQNFLENQKDIKKFEDEIINIIYNR